MTEASMAALIIGLLERMNDDGFPKCARTLFWKKIHDTGSEMFVTWP